MIGTQLSLLGGEREATHEQLDAAHAGPDGAFLIAAGPGTGKTFTMVERFAWLVQACGVPADAILTVTFTDKAAEELRERIASRLGGGATGLSRTALDAAWIGTFHSICARLLQEHAYLIGMPRELKVLDELGQRLLMAELNAELRSGEEPCVDLEELTALQPDEVAELLKHGLQFVLKLKGRGIGPDQFERKALELHATHDHGGDKRQAGEAEREAIQILHAIYSSYERCLRERTLLDFDDLILETLRALERVPEFRARCRAQFRYLLVDEFQDSNRIQLDLIRLLAADGFGNVAVVGDAKQSIYGWRDADIENIRTRFPGEKLPLTQNRRSFQQVLDLATAFIRRDEEFAAEPELVADRGGASAAPIKVMMTASPEQEAALVSGEIRRLVAHGTRYSEIAVLARSLRYLPPEFEQQLQRDGIPYVTSSGTGFFDREEVKDVVALMRLVDNPFDDAALVRVLQGPVVRLADAGMYRLALRRAGRKGVRLRDCFDEALVETGAELPAQVAGRARMVLEVTDRLADAKEALTVADVLNQVLDETGYLRHCQLRSLREGPRALLNLRKVFRMANRFETDSSLAGIGDFIRHLDELMGADVDVSEAEHESGSRVRDEKPDAVQVLTMHKAKGLEFPAVFLINTRPPNARDTERLFFEPDGFGFVMKWWRTSRHPCYEATLPATQAMSLARQEQRRLVYVALTRAKDRLFVSSSRPTPTFSSPPSGEALTALTELADEGDHFAEILTWALAHPVAAAVVTSEQLELPALAAPATPEADGKAAIATVLDRVAWLRQASARQPAPVEAQQPVRLSFSQLQLFDLCPVRFRFSEIWEVPAPPDELLPGAARAGGTDLGAAVHAALARWHGVGAAGDLVALFSELAQAMRLDPDDEEDGRQMLARYLTHPLAQARTLGSELEFNLRLGNARVRGLVDRVCEYQGRTALVDYKTNRQLEESLLNAYRTQLRLYAIASRHGLLPGGPEPALWLFDLRRTEAIEVAPDDAAVTGRLVQVTEKIRAGDFRLGPEHAQRPCFVCAYRPLCPDSRV